MRNHSSDAEVFVLEVTPCALGRVVAVHVVHGSFVCDIATKLDGFQVGGVAIKEVATG